jgi:hypothetical protein
MDFRRLPICILSHDRPAYLRPMLEALAAAMAEAGMFGPVLLFQDGARDGADPRPAAACVQAFHTALPHGVAFGSAEHLGIARNLHRAETWAFDSMRYPAALFFEDDLVVGRSYFRAMAALGEQAPAKVALFSASGLDPRATRPEQVERRRQVGPLVRDWGYCLTREAWLKCQPHWRDYLDLLDGGEPRLDRVAAWYGRLGWPPLPAHQSFAKSVLLNTLGYARIGSVANCARNIGAAGHLYTPAEFQRHGFADAALLEDGDWQFDALDDAQLDGIVLAQRQAALRQRLGADSFIGNQALIDALRLRLLPRPLGPSARHHRLSARSVSARTDARRHRRPAFAARRQPGNAAQRPTRRRRVARPRRAVHLHPAVPAPAGRAGEAADGAVQREHRPVLGWIQ